MSDRRADLFHWTPSDFTPVDPERALAAKAKAVARLERWAKNQRAASAVSAPCVATTLASTAAGAKDLPGLFLKAWEQMGGGDLQRQKPGHKMVAETMIRVRSGVEPDKMFKRLVCDAKAAVAHKTVLIVGNIENSSPVCKLGAQWNSGSMHIIGKPTGHTPPSPPGFIDFGPIGGHYGIGEKPLGYSGKHEQHR